MLQGSAASRLDICGLVWVLAAGGVLFVFIVVHRIRGAVQSYNGGCALWLGGVCNSSVAGSNRQVQIFMEWGFNSYSSSCG